jgi:hypothetical protein
MTNLTLQQSDDFDDVFITVRLDDDGSARWAVQAADQLIFCSSGVRAVEICRAIRRSKAKLIAEQ